MLRFVINRLIGSLIVLFIIVSASFFLMRFAPGGPFDEERKLPPNIKANKWLVFGMGTEFIAPEAGLIVETSELPPEKVYEEGTHLATLEATGPMHFGWMTFEGVDTRSYRFEMPSEGTLAALPIKMGKAVTAGSRLAVVEKSSWEQYTNALSNYMVFEFGTTISSDGERTVKENLLQALPISLELGLWALIFAVIFGVATGLISGLKQNTWVDYSAMSGAMVGISVPTMVSGPLFIAIFIIGQEPCGPDASFFCIDFEYGAWDGFGSKILPVITLGLFYTAAIARLTRGGMLDVIRSDYIRTARAKGLAERQVVMGHAFKGAILPTVSYLGPAIARIVTGSVVVEKVFNIPGLADHFIDPALNRDYPMVVGVIVVYSVLLVVMNLIVDVLYTVLDPRVSYD